jgi:SHAQKYF class myb-like DNA-binding protein
MQRTKQNIFKIDKSNDNSSKAKDVSIVHNETFSKVNQSTNKGRWNKKEHIMFLHGIVRYGNNWKKIKELIKTRSNAQARSHGQKFFIKLKENKHFSFGPFINIKHFFNKIKGYNHSQKQLLFQELKAIPFDSDETCTTNENTFYNKEKNVNYISNNNTIKSYSLNNINTNGVECSGFKLNNYLSNQTNQEIENNSKLSTFDEMSFLKTQNTPTINNSDTKDNSNNNSYNCNELKINSNNQLLNHAFSFTNNCNPLFLPCNINQFNLDTYLNQQQQQYETNRYNLLLSSLLLHSYYLMNQQIINNMSNQSNN